MVPESTFTAPHSACQHPEWWTAHDSDSTECEVTELVAAFVRAIQPALVVETGTAFGYTARAIGRALRRNGHGRLVTLETDRGRFVAALDRLERHGLLITQGGPVDARMASSLDYVPDAGIQFAWFDSMYELRIEEFVRYRDLGALTAGTIVGFHDWTSGLRGHYFDVKADIDRIAAAGLVRPVFVPGPRGTAICEVL